MGCGRNTPVGVKCADKAYKLIICGVRTEYPMWGADKAYMLWGADKAYNMWGADGIPHVGCGQGL